jgi:hypothetical protein
MGSVKLFIMNDLRECRAMRIETLTAWMLAGFGLLSIGTLLSMLEVTGKLGRFLVLLGLAYLGIAFVLAVVRDRHMTKRMRARRK